MRPIVINPWTTLIGFGTLLGFALWCIIDPVQSKVQLGVWQSWVTKEFSWFYIGSQDVWIIFLGIVFYYYGDRKLGKDDDRPEFDNVAYFAMLFSSGVAVGMFVYGTAEPLYHYDYWVKQRFNGKSFFILVLIC
jgi:choline-glycine betaine transporter